MSYDVNKMGRMTKDEFRKLMRQPKKGEIGISDPLWRVSTPNGERLFNAVNIDAAMRIAEAIPGAGYPSRIDRSTNV